MSLECKTPLEISLTTSLDPSLTPSPYPSIIEISLESKLDKLINVSFLVACKKWSRNIHVAVPPGQTNTKTKLYVPKTENIQISHKNLNVDIQITSILKLSLGTMIDPLQVDPSNDFLISAIHQAAPPFSTSHICIIPENHDKMALSDWILSRHVLCFMGFVGNRLSKSKYKLKTSNLNEIKDILIETKLWPREDCQLLACILNELEGNCVMTCVLMQLLEWKFQKTKSRLLLIGDSRIPNATKQDKQVWTQSLNHVMVEDMCKNQEIIMIDEKIISMSREGAKKLLVLIGKTLNSNFKSNGGKIIATEEWPDFWNYLYKNFSLGKQAIPANHLFSVDRVWRDTAPCHCCSAFKIMFVLPMINMEFDIRDLSVRVLKPIQEQMYPRHLIDKILILSPLQLASLSISSLFQLKIGGWHVVVLTKPESLVLIKIARACNLDVVPKTVIFASEFLLFEQWVKNPRAIEMAMAQKFDWMDSGRKNKDSIVPVLIGFQEFAHLTPTSVQHNVASRRLSLTKKQKSMISIR